MCVCVCVRERECYACKKICRLASAVSPTPFPKTGHPASEPPTDTRCNLRADICAATREDRLCQSPWGLAACLPSHRPPQPSQWYAPLRFLSLTCCVCPHWLTSLLSIKPNSTLQSDMMDSAVLMCCSLPLRMSRWSLQWSGGGHPQRECSHAHVCQVPLHRPPAAWHRPGVQAGPSCNEVRLWNSL